jgi:hypothetical protein
MHCDLKEEIGECAFWGAQCLPSWQLICEDLIFRESSQVERLGQTTRSLLIQASFVYLRSKVSSFGVLIFAFPASVSNRSGEASV